MTGTTQASPQGARATLLARAGRVRVASWATAGLLIVAVVLAVALQPNLLSPYGVASTFATFLPLVLVAVAQAIVVIGGGLDLSAGAIVALASVVAVQVMQGDDALALLGFGAAIGTGLACGLVNGLIVSRLRLQPLIATFATASVFSGLALLVLPTPGGSVPAILTGTFRQAVASVPVSVLLVAAVALGWLVLRQLKIMRHIRATGGGPAAAYASLVPVAGAQLASYAISGAVCGLAGLAVLGNAGSGDPFIGGDLALNSVAAVVIGGIALRGGIGSPIGAIAGAITLSLASTILFALGLPTSWRALAAGLVVILALALSALGAPRRQR